MLTISLLAGCAILAAVVVHEHDLLPATVNPFGGNTVTDPTAETLASGSADPTLAGDWKRAELHSLSEVERLLDALEARHVRQREMDVVSDDTFVVRWR
jgi:hypothetical protein